MNPNDLTPDEAAAALALATEMSEGLMPQAPLESPQTQEMGATSDETPEIGKDTMMQDYGAKMEDFKKEIKEMIKEEIAGIKETIQEALKDKNE